MLVSSFFELFGSNWIFHLPAGKGQIAVTFDDGPDEETTPKILDALHSLNIPSTFFVVGKQCITNEPVLCRINSENHSIANHGFWHERHLHFNFLKTVAKHSAYA